MIPFEANPELWLVGGAGVGVVEDDPGFVEDAITPQLPVTSDMFVMYSTSEGRDHATRHFNKINTGGPNHDCKTILNKKVPLSYDGVKIKIYIH